MNAGKARLLLSDKVRLPNFLRRRLANSNMVPKSIQFKSINANSVHFYSNHNDGITLKAPTASADTAKCNGVLP